MIAFPASVRVWLAVGRTDMPRGMTGLALCWARTPCFFDGRRSMVWPPLARRTSITSRASSRTGSTEP